MQRTGINFHVSSHTLTHIERCGRLWQECKLVQLFLFPMFFISNFLTSLSFIISFSFPTLSFFLPSVIA